MRFIVVLIFTFLFSHLVIGQNDLSQKAEQAYNQKDYKTAIKLYEQLNISDPNNTGIIYNLANSYQVNNDIAKAIYQYERAALLNPGNDDIQYNLTIANEGIENPISDINNFFLSQWYWDIVHQYKSTTIFIWTFVFVVLFLLFLYLVLFKKIAFLKSYKWLLGTLLLLLLLIHYNLFSSRVHIETGSHGIVMEQSAMRSGADERSQHLQDIDPGIKVAVLDSIQTWYKISLPDKEQGWIQKEKVNIIK